MLPADKLLHDADQPLPDRLSDRVRSRADLLQCLPDAVRQPLCVALQLALRRAVRRQLCSVRGSAGRCSSSAAGRSSAAGGAGR